MGLPLHDWQFWVTTGCAAIAAGYLLRNVLPVPYFSKRAKRRKQEKGAVLTISAKGQEGEGGRDPRRRDQGIQGSRDQADGNA